MSKRWCIVIVSFMAVILAIVVWQVPSHGETEPVYQGKNLDQWLVAKEPTDYDPSISTPVIEALRQMGTNSLPYLIRDLRSEDGLFWRKLPLSAYRFGLIRRLRNMCGPCSSDRQARAIYFLEALGPAATPAIPALSDCLDDSRTADHAVEILGHYDSIGRVVLGPEATLPLLKAMTNGSDNVRRIAANRLGLLHSKPDLVIPALVQALKDPSPGVRAMAASSFGGYKAEASTIVPALMETLDDTNSFVRQQTIWMLGRYRAKASASIPRLLVHLKDSELGPRIEATNALKLIEPDGTSKTGLQ